MTLIDFVPLIVSFLGSIVSVKIIVATAPYHRQFSHDDNFSGIQQYHTISTPRIGGLAFLAGLIVGGAYHGIQGDHTLLLAKWAGVAALPVFLGGFFEDVTRNVSAGGRLLLSFLSAAIAYYELNVGLTNIGWNWFDETIMPKPGVSLLLTILMMGGVAHSTNIIDGFHGLLLGIAIAATTVFCYVGTKVDANLLVLYMTIMIGSMLGIITSNFPKGKIFLGDGGAYLIGFLLALFSLLLVKKYPTISPWFPLLVLIYPVTETLFSIYRKKILRGKSAMVPDRLHLHMLIYRRVSHRPRLLGSLNRNAATSVVMWAIGVAPMVPAAIWWNHPGALITSIIVFVLGYLFIYKLVIIRYKLIGQRSTD